MLSFSVDLNSPIASYHITR